MTVEEYEHMLSILASARHLHKRLSRVFYRFGHGIYQLISDDDRDFIDGLEIEPFGNFQRNDGSEDIDTLLVSRFSLEFLGIKYDFHFRTIPAGEVDILRGEIMVSTRGTTDVEAPVELARLIFDANGDLLAGPKVTAGATDRLTSFHYCSGFTAQLLFNHGISNKTLD